MNYKVLIVDDSKLARMAAIKVLTACYPTWSRVEAGSADDAVSSARKDSPDIALLDYNMPGRNGLDVAAELRAIRPRMPIAVISANHQQEVVNRTHALGAAFLPKPLSEKSLGDFLASAAQELGKAAP